MNIESRSVIYELKKITTIKPRIKNGPKGISLFIVTFSCPADNRVILPNKIIPRPKSAPIQKARTIAIYALLIPKNQPIPSASFASPNPIHVPCEKYQRAANGAK